MDIITTYPQFRFIPASYFSWLPEIQTITFDPKRIGSSKGKIQLLHEIGHALLRHQNLEDNYRYQAEREAWNLAREIALMMELKRQELMIARQLQELRRQGY